MRPRQPDEVGVVHRNGEHIHYEVYGDDGPTIFLATTWQIVHSRHWKMQVPYLSRHYRVVTYDPVGNGKSSRAIDPTRYSLAEVAADALAVLDATGTERSISIGFSYGGGLVAYLAGAHPERFDGVIAIAPSHPFGVSFPGEEGVDGSVMATFEDELEDPQGWQKFNLHFWRTNWPDFVEFFFGKVCSDPRSTKGFDDMVGWAMETSGDVIAAQGSAPRIDLDQLDALVRSIELPFLIVHGKKDLVINHASSEILAKMVGADLVSLHHAGHNPHGRYPVKVNSLVKDFADRVYGRQPDPTAWHVGHDRPRKALFISSPIGLGHARRDIAIANELRARHPELEIEWLAQDPVTRVLAGQEETIHPASQFMASESAHIEGESGEHDLAVFQALRDMDEILLANFMLFDEVIADGQYDLVIGDESWEVDYHLHENPNRKRTSYAWLTDFVGYLPMPSRGAREAFVAADYNAEMIEQIARYPRVRDRAIFVGSPDDIVPDRFGPDLPLIREWTEAHFEFSGYITGFDPATVGDKAALRDELGYRQDEQVCIVTVGGSGVGGALIQRVAGCFPATARSVPDLRMVVVTGPRLDADSLPKVEGVEYRSYVPDLHRHLAACDLAIVQGGLTTTMELTAAKVPFIYVPLRNHFEQSFHVPARLERYGAGRHLAYADIDEDSLSAAIAEEIGRRVDYRDVESDGAARAATMIGDLL